MGGFPASATKHTRSRDHSPAEYSKNHLSKHCHSASLLCPVTVPNPKTGLGSRLDPPVEAAGGGTSTRSTRGRPTPLRFGHLRSDAPRLRAVLRCDTGIATNAHGTTTAMRGRCRRRRPADSRATQSSHLPGTPGRRAPEARRTWKRSRRALQQRCATFGTRPGSAWFGYGLTEHRQLYGPQRLQAGRVAGGACCLSQCSRRLPALPSASRGRSRRMPPASRALRSTAYSTSPRPKGRAACRCGVAVACRPWAPAGPADRTGSGQEQKCA